MAPSATAIDIHAHFYPSDFLKLVAAEGGRFGVTCRETANGPVVDVGPLHAGPIAAKFIDLDLRLGAMDEQRVAIQALSLTQPMVYWADDTISRRLSASFNDALVAANEHSPQRFFGLAMLPMQYPREALLELDRVAAAPGIRGIYMGTAIGDMPLSDPSLFAVFERIESLGLPVFLHPLKVIGMEDRLSEYFLANLLGNPFDTAAAAAHLMFGGVLDRFPALQIVLPHAGGALPYLAGRLAHGWRVRPECAHLPRSPLEYLKRFHYDTIAHSDAALKFLIDLVGAERVLLGSDYCFDMGYDQPVRVIEAHPDLDDVGRDLISRGNARRLIGL
jgi:aminocarboxymuconate-semialdehyde decarboxylase